MFRNGQTYGAMFLACRSSAARWRVAPAPVVTASVLFQGSVDFLQVRVRLTSTATSTTAASGAFLGTRLGRLVLVGGTANTAVTESCKTIVQSVANLAHKVGIQTFRTSLSGRESSPVLLGSGLGAVGVGLGGGGGRLGDGLHRCGRGLGALIVITWGSKSCQWRLVSNRTYTHSKTGRRVYRGARRGSVV